MSTERQVDSTHSHIKASRQEDRQTDRQTDIPRQAGKPADSGGRCLRVRSVAE